MATEGHFQIIHWVPDEIGTPRWMGWIGKGIIYIYIYIWLVVWNMFYFSIYWECHHPNWRTPSFFRGTGQPPTRKYRSDLRNIDVRNPARWPAQRTRGTIFWTLGVAMEKTCSFLVGLKWFEQMEGTSRLLYFAITFCYYSLSMPSLDAKFDPNGTTVC